MTNPTEKQSPELRRISIELLERIETARGLNEETIERLQASIVEHGLLQPILVVENQGAYEIVSGNHRTEACRRNGQEEIDAIALPAETTREAVLEKSLHENHVRSAETLPDIMKRVHALASYHDCKFEEGARLAGVSRSTYSKIQTVLNKLCSQAMEIIAKNNIGISISYEVARRAKEDEQQIKWLNAHASGHMSREEIIAASKQNGPEPKGHNVSVTIDEVEVKFSMPKDLTYAKLHSVLTTLKSRIGSHAKQKHPIDLLPRLM